jgi:hypothetical protein
MIGCCRDIKWLHGALLAQVQYLIPIIYSVAVYPLWQRRTVTCRTGAPTFGAALRVDVRFRGLRSWP